MRRRSYATAQQTEEVTAETNRRPRWRYFSPQTKMGWIPRRSIPIAATSFCYALPFLWGAWPMYVLQVVPSFMSDYVMIGRESYWHPIDRSLALFNSIFTITTAFWAIEWWEVLLLALATYSNYFASVYFTRHKNFLGFEISHTIWHLVGSASISYVTVHACGYQTSWGRGCKQEWVGGLYCNCFKA